MVNNNQVEYDKKILLTKSLEIPNKTPEKVEDMFGSCNVSYTSPNSI